MYVWIFYFLCNMNILLYVYTLYTFSDLFSIFFCLRMYTPHLSFFSAT